MGDPRGELSGLRRLRSRTAASRRAQSAGRVSRRNESRVDDRTRIGRKKQTGVEKSTLFAWVPCIGGGNTVPQANLRSVALSKKGLAPPARRSNPRNCD